MTQVCHLLGHVNCCRNAVTLAQHHLEDPLARLAEVDLVPRVTLSQAGEDMAALACIC